jgi:hypothetical protein
MVDESTVVAREVACAAAPPSILKRYAPMKVMLDRCIVANVIRGLKALSLGENRVRFAATRSVRDQAVISTPHRQSRLLTRLL